MKILFVVVVLSVLSFGCKDKATKKLQDEKDKKEFVMVATSEMSNLMKEMYTFNESIKQQVIEGRLNLSYPEKFNTIHSATMTDPKDRDDTFETFSKLFIQHEKAIFKSSKEDLVLKYNNAINTCIACHLKKCSGPIPRIKKLLIK
ncbi:MAG: hypothetical protein HRT67_04680 [Flavobacteriaceae bacterium]|nr:hypothetical protein [Flavobacteriaceae bacterium]